MHSSIILLVFFSILLIILMITCFICFIRSRRKEDQEFMEQVQFQAARQQDYQSRQQQLGASPKQQCPSDQMMITSSASEQFANSASQQCNPDNPGQQSNAIGARNAYFSPSGAVSPYHANQMAQQHQAAAAQRIQTETRSDITQQINSAIIGSSEAEFQNDFIQVFPMYQIAPQPEKNTTPYLT